MTREHELSRQRLAAAAVVRRVACVLAGVIGLVGLLGYAFDSLATASVLPFSEPVSPSAAFTFVLLAAAMLLQASGRRSPLARRMTTLLAVLAAVRILFDLGHFAVHPSHWTKTVPETVLEGMAPVTAAIMLLLVGGVLMTGSSRRFPFSNAFATAAMTGTIVVLFGFVFHVVSFSSPDIQLVPVRASVAALLALALAVLLGEPRRGWVGLALSSTPAGTLLRVVAPATLFLPLAIEVARRHAVDTHLVSRALSSAIAAGGQMLILSTLAFGAAFLLYRRDEARRASEQRFRATFDRAPVGIAHASLDGRVLRVNRKITEILGYDEHEAARLHIEEVIHPDDSAATGGLLDALKEGTITSYAQEKSYRRRDGSYVPVRVTVAQATEPDGTPYLISIIEDVTDRRQLEAAAAAHRHALEEAQRIAHLGNWVWDLGTNEITWSDELYRIFGVPPSTAVTFETMMACIHPGDRAAVMTAIEQAIASATPGQVEHRLVTADGEERIVLERGEVELAADGTPHRLIGTTQDVTQERRTQQALRDAETRFRAELEELVAQRTTELAAANRELEAFAYSVSHDLRAPLRSMDGFSRLLLDDADQVPPRSRDYLARIRRASQTMGQLIDDMLSLSRVTRQELQIAPVDLSGMAREVAADLIAATPSRNVEFVIADGLHVRADAALMRIVLQNLIGNAWKFTSKSERARIELGAIDTDGRRTFFVRDDGAGFDPRYTEKLFSPFQRLHRAAEFEGTGIGLATVQRILHRHGGEARAEGRPGEGATIYFTLGLSTPPDPM